MPHARLLYSLVAVVLLPLGASSVWSQAATPSGEFQIDAVRIEAEDGTPRPDLLPLLQTKAGSLYDADLCDRDIENLWRAASVRVAGVYLDRTEGGSLLRFVIAGSASVERIVFRNADAEGHLEDLSFNLDRLTEEAGILTVRSVDQETLAPVVVRLKRFYRSEGYALVEVDGKIDEKRGEAVISILENNLVRVAAVRFVGNAELPATSFMGLRLNLSSALSLGDGFLFFPGSNYSREAAERDAIAVAELYRSVGYLDATVSLDEVAFNDARDRVEVVFKVEEGRRYTVRKVEFRSLDPEQPLSFEQDELRGKTALKPGMFYSDEIVRADRSVLRRHYGEQGYPSHYSLGRDSWRFGVGTAREPILTFDRAAAQVEVVYPIQEGRRLRIRDIIISGNTVTQDQVIRRQIELNPGSFADSGELDRSKRRLQALNYFTDRLTQLPFADYRFRPTDNPGWVDVSFEVQEGDTGQFRGGGGYNDQFGPFANIMFTKRNFDLSKLFQESPLRWRSPYKSGAGQTLNLMVMPGIDASYYNVEFVEPDLFGGHVKRISLSTRFYKMIEYLPTPERLQHFKSGAVASISRHFSRYFSVSLGAELGYRDIPSPASGGAGMPQIVQDSLGKNDLNALDFGVSYNTTIDNLFSPDHGGSVSLRFRQAGEMLGGELDYRTATIRGTRYFTLFEDDRGRKHVLEARAAGRLARDTGSGSGLTYGERFFLGGQSSLRGFDYRGIGDIEGGYRLGGEASWSTGLEYTFPIASSQTASGEDLEYVRGSFFFDAGALGDDLSAFGPTRQSVGFGIKIRIPALQVPLAFHFGWPIADQPLDTGRFFTFSMGIF